MLLSVTSLVPGGFSFPLQSSSALVLLSCSSFCRVLSCSDIPTTVARLHRTYCSDAPARRNVREFSLESCHVEPQDVTSTPATLRIQCGDSCRTIHRCRHCDCAATGWHGVVVKRDDSVGENLEGMATLTGDQHGVAATSAGKRRFDRGRRSGSTQTFPGWWNPASRSLRIWPGSSVRGY